MDMILGGKPFKDISYIRVLQFAANKAVGLGLSSRSDVPRIGFTLAEIKQDNNCKDIQESWLKEILPSICTVRVDGVEVGSIDESKWGDYEFVIRSEEFIKLATLISVKKAHTSLMVAIFAIFFAIIVPPLTVIGLTSAVDVKNVSLDSEAIKKLVRNVRVNIDRDKQGNRDCASE